MSNAPRAQNDTIDDQIHLPSPHLVEISKRSSTDHDMLEFCREYETHPRR